MNVTYDEIDGKPTMVTPAHVNLGLAIDHAEAGRHPPAGGAVASRRCRDDGLRRSSGTAYEDLIVRKPADDKLTAEDYSGHHGLA